MLDFDRKKRCFFEAACPPYPLLRIILSSEVYRPKLKKKRRFVFFGRLTGLEITFEFSKKAFRKAQAHHEEVRPVWDIIWTRSFNAMQNDPLRADLEHLEKADEIEIHLTRLDPLRSTIQATWMVQFIGFGHWCVLLDSCFNVLDCEGDF